MLAHLEAMLAYLEGNVGPSWGYVGPSWGYVGPSWGYVGPSWSYVGPSWGYVGPSWGLCWPILRLCWSILRPMLAHVDPSRATRSEKWEKHVECHRAKKHCKLQGVLSTRAPYQRLAAGAAAPLFFMERRELPYGKDTARGPWPDLRG